MDIERPNEAQPLEIPMLAADKESPIKIGPSSEYAATLRKIKASNDLAELQRILAEYQNILSAGANQLSREDIFGCGAVIRYARDRVRRKTAPGLQKGDIPFLKRSGRGK